LRFARQPFLGRLAIIVMMTATVAFALQGICVAASEAATGDSSHYYLGFAFHHPGGIHSHIITHRHADGTIHTHAIDDDPGALAKHIKKPGWNMALVVCVVPDVAVPALSELAGEKLTIENPPQLWVADLEGLRRPPRPPCIA
jgi:hypothetical protein